MAENALLDLAARAVDAARAAGATASDALVVAATDRHASIRNGAPETIGSAESNGLGLRVFVGASSATLSTSELTADAIAALAEKAVAIATHAPADPYAGLADAALLGKRIATLDITDREMPEMSQLQTMARDAENAGRGMAHITNSNGAEASASRHAVALVTSHGFAHHYATTRYGISASLIAGSGETMQRDYDYATATHLADLPHSECVGIAAASRAAAKLSPRKLPTQTATIYFEPRVGRSLLSAFAGAISGAAIARGTSFLKDALDTELFPRAITITDDPQRPRGLGSRPFDAEGIATQRRDFIAEGRLTSWVLDHRSANQLGLTTTGHASRGLSGAPHPSTTNLYLHGSKKSPAELFAKYGNGFLVTETIGHGVNLITGDYSVGASGYWLEDGVRAYPVSEVTIAGNLRDMFARLAAADDLAFRYATNVPTLAIPQMTIAGN